MLEATLGFASVVRRRRVMSLDPGFPRALPFTMTAGGPIPARVETRWVTANQRLERALAKTE